MYVPYLDLAAAHEEIRLDIERAIAAVIDRGSFVLGPEIAAFEREFALSAGSAHCVGVGCGFDALAIGLRALGVGEGDEVIVPTNTYVATWLAASAVGAKPIGCEPDPDTANLDHTRLDECWSPRTRAVLPVHLYGQPADMARICQWARDRGVAVLADAAHAHGARIGDRQIGAIGGAVAWSFYPSKNLGALGDAGAITTDDPDVAKRASLLRNYGSNQRDVNRILGVNSRLDEIQAAVLRVKLRRLSESNRRRRENAARYLELLRGLDLVLPHVMSGVTPAWHIFAVRVPSRASVTEVLGAEGIQTLVHYPVPPFAQEAYAHLGIKKGTYPIAEKLAGEVLSLPVGPHMAEAQQMHVIETLRRALGAS